MASTTSKNCLICLDLQPDRLGSVRLMSIRPELRAQARILQHAREEQQSVLHLRQEGVGAAVEFLRLAPKSDEAVFIRPAGTPPFADLQFRRHINSIDPSQVEVMAATRSTEDTAFAIALTNVGFRVHLLAETLQPQRQAFDPLMIASQTELHHPGLRVARGPKHAVSAHQKRTANEN